MAPRRTKTVDGNGFASAGYSPGPNYVRCPPCSKNPRWANSSLKGYWFNPNKASSGGMCPNAGCSWCPKANSKRFGGIPTPNDMPSKRTAAAEQTQAEKIRKADEQRKKEVGDLQRKVRKLEAEAAGKPSDAAAEPAPAAAAKGPAAGGAAKPDAAEAKKKLEQLQAKEKLYRECVGQDPDDQHMAGKLAAVVEEVKAARSECSR